MSVHSLLIYRPDGSIHVVKLGKPTIAIGRGDENDVVLEDPLRNISRLHALIRFSDGGAAVLSDLKSANGTFLNDRPVNGPCELCHEDVFHIGQYRLVYHNDGSVSQPERETTSAFQIEASEMELDKLQEHTGLLDPGEGLTIAVSPPELVRLELLHEVGVRLARTVTTADVIETSVDLLFKIQGVQRSALMLWDEEHETFSGSRLHVRPGLELEQVATLEPYDPRNLVLSKTIFRKVRTDNRPLLIHDAWSQAELSTSMSIMRAGIQAFCSPLTFQGRFLGVLYGDNLVAPDAFSAEDFRTFTTISAQAGLALASALTRGELLKQQVEQAAMRLYLPPQVADLITTSGGSIELGGVLQPVTVLFADIRGFTRLSEQMDAREVVLLLNEFFTAMTQVIFGSGGTLDKYIGDCVMALFGAPVPAQDDLDRGLRAAIDMQREVSRLNVGRLQRGLIEIGIGVGVHHGPAVVGNIGSGQRMQYTAIGDTVNVAARVAARAAPGQVLVSEDVRLMARNRDSFVHLGKVELKGRQREISLYSVPWEDVS